MSLTKTALNWSAIALEALVGILLLAELDRLWGYRASASEWYLLAAFALFGFASVIASTTAIRNPKRAGLLLLLLTPFGFAASFLTQIDRLRNEMIVWYVLVWYSFLATLTLLLAPALFWLGMYRLKWAPVMSQSEAFSPKRKIARFARTVAAVLVLVLAASLALNILIPPIGFDCAKGGPISRFGPGQMVFVGRVISTLGPCQSYLGRRYCNGAVALVSERFWGVRSKLVLLTGDFFEDGERYLIDGARADGPLTRLIPLVRFRPCNKTARVEDSAVNLRVLRSGIPITGVRIIGEVTRYNGKKREPAPGIEVVIEGPAGMVTVTTDKEGIYEIAGLSRGRYQIHTKASGYDSRHHQCGSGEDLGPGDIGGCQLFADD
jgi:hypothetical protein